RAPARRPHRLRPHDVLPRTHDHRSAGEEQQGAAHAPAHPPVRPDEAQRPQRHALLPHPAEPRGGAWDAVRFVTPASGRLYRRHRAAVAAGSRAYSRLEGGAPPCNIFAVMIETRLSSLLSPQSIALDFRAPSVVEAVERLMSPALHACGVAAGQ